jgi:RHS repeat-associated protein
MMADSTGNVVGQQGHYPFGESWYQTNTTTKWFFTTYERDSESGNDYAMARYGTNRLGRFASPDPVAGSRSDPQSVNRYAYVRNDPVNGLDPLGLDDSWICGYGNDDCGGNLASPGGYGDGLPAGLYDDPLATCGAAYDTPCFSNVVFGDPLLLDSGGRGTSGYVVDGNHVSANMAQALQNMGAAVECPGDVCGAWVNGQYEQFFCTIALCGYLSQEQQYTMGHECGNSFCDGQGFLKWAIQNDPKAAQSQVDAINKLLGTDYTVGDAAFLLGRNLDFPVDPSDWSAFVGPDAVCGSSGRCSGDLEGVHFVEANGEYYVHLDTADPFGSVGGFFQHAWTDVIGGNVAYYIIPRR